MLLGLELGLCILYYSYRGGLRPPYKYVEIYYRTTGVPESNSGVLEPSRKVLEKYYRTSRKHVRSTRTFQKSTGKEMILENF